MGRDGNTRPVPFSMGIPVPLTPMIVLAFPEGTTMALISHTEGISPRDSCRQQGKILLGPSSRAVFGMSTNQTAIGAPGAVPAAVGAGSTPVGGSTSAVTATSPKIPWYKHTFLEISRRGR